MFRLFVSNDSIESTNCVLSDEDFHYLSRVLRLKKGEVIDIVVDETELLTVEVQDFKKTSLYFKLISRVVLTKSSLDIILFQCLPKGDKFSDIINQSTQLSCSEIIPLTSSRSMVKLDAKKVESKHLRWSQIAKQASQQSQQNRITLVHEPLSIMSLDVSLYALDVFFILWEDEKKQTFKSKLRDLYSDNDSMKTKRIGVVVGPEGGLSEEEVRYLEGIGGKIVTLGSSIYRVEIASLVCISQLMYQFS